MRAFRAALMPPALLSKTNTHRAAPAVPAELQGQARQDTMVGQAAETRQGLGMWRCTLRHPWWTVEVLLSRVLMRSSVNQGGWCGRSSLCQPRMQIQAGPVKAGLWAGGCGFPISRCCSNAAQASRKLLCPR